MDDDKTEIAEKRLQEEIMKSIGQEVISKETLRHIAYYRALTDGASEELLLKIKSGNMFEDDLNKILNSEFSSTDLEHFHERPKEKCRQCKQEFDGEQNEWKSDDGMTNSVMSTQDDKWKLMLIKQGKNEEREQRNDNKNEVVLHGIDGKNQKTKH